MQYAVSNKWDFKKHIGKSGIVRIGFPVNEDFLKFKSKLYLR
jgi:hypothetical protein